jgi:hypothetical protein
VVRAAIWLAALAAVCSCLTSSTAQAQVRGVYPLGMGAIGSGTLPDSGVTYSNLFLFYSRDRLIGPDGRVIASGHNSVLMDMNTIAWTSGSKKLVGARVSLSVTIPIANNSLTNGDQGAVSGGGGLADSFYQPLILGWQLRRADLKVGYGFLAPTGRFRAGATDNVGSGYWTHTLSAGETVYLGEDQATALSAFEMYEFHGSQWGSGIHPGQNADLDYSLTRIVRLRDDLRLRVGAVGYAQWQTTPKGGSIVTAAEAATRYRVYAIGLAANLILPTRQLNLGVRWFDELASRSTLEGNSVQIAVVMGF